MIRKLSLSAAFLFCVLSATRAQGASDSSHQATVVRLEGQASILKAPQDKAVPGRKGQVLFDGKYFQKEDLRRGLKIQRGEVVQTGSDGKVLLIFPNGDNITVSASTAYRLDWEDPKKPVMDLIFGKVRTLIRKGGARKELDVRASSAVMGVRGTDFFVEARDKDGNSKVFVFRGEVSVAPKEAPTETVMVKKGFSAQVPPSAAATQNSKDKVSTNRQNTPQTKGRIVMRQATQSEVLEIQKDSEIKAASSKMQEKDIPKEERAALAKLEKQAFESTLEDIKEHDPELYKSIQESPRMIGTNISNLKTLSSREVFKGSPKSVEAKPSLKDFQGKSEDEVYDKYFKIE